MSAVLQRSGLFSRDAASLSLARTFLAQSRRFFSVFSSVQKNAADEGRYEVKEAKNGKHHFNLKAGNGQVIGSSQLYKTESGMKKGIASVGKNAGDAKVSDLTA